MKSIKKLTFGASICAISLVIMFIGGAITLADLSCAVICSALMLLAVIEFSAGFSFLIFAVISVLAFLVLPNKTVLYLFIFGAGWYPIVKYYIDLKMRRVTGLIVKYVLFNIMMAGYLLFSAYVLMLPETKLIYIIIAVAANIVFYVFDKALTVIITYYLGKIRPRLEKSGFFGKL